MLTINSYKRMKNALLVFALLLSIPSSCKKDEKEPVLEKCPTCPIAVFNQTQFPVKLYIDGVFKKELPSATVYNGEIPSDNSHNIKGDVLSPFAHNDHTSTVSCGLYCPLISIAIK